jgi:cytochrome c-type biogenesis protein CcmH
VSRRPARMHGRRGVAALAAMSVLAALVVLALIAAATPALAAGSVAEAEARVQQLAAELRCPVCRNQSLADSDAPMAADLRAEIRRQVQAGRSDAEVRRFMVERYGDVVSYKPPVAARTLPLWLAPFALLLAVAAVLWWRIARRWRAAPPARGPA